MPLHDTRRSAPPAAVPKRFLLQDSLRWANKIQMSHGTAVHPVHELMSRTGSFPVGVAVELLQKHAQKGGVVLDPFCGKGTSLLAARVLGLDAYGMDIAPEAVICTRAKMAGVDLQSVESYVQGIRLGRPSLADVPSAVQVFFTERTLRQILSFRNAFLRDISSQQASIRDNATFALALLLGILHGHATYSLSVSSAHAYAMAPNYVKKYSRKMGLSPPERNVRSCLLEKLQRCLATALPSPVASAVIQGTALECATAFADLRGLVDVILTSPPYLNAQTYAKDNWLRQWLLGYDYRDLRPAYIQTGSVSKYGEFMAKVFQQFSQLLKPSGVLVCIGGVVRRTKRRGDIVESHRFNTGRFLANLAGDDGFVVDNCADHHVPSKQRYLHSLTQTNGHRVRDLTETLFVARRERDGGRSGK